LKPGKWRHDSQLRPPGFCIGTPDLYGLAVIQNRLYFKDEFVCPDHISPTAASSAVDLPTDELSLRFYTLGDDDLESIEAAADRKTGLALPCTTALISGRALAPGEMIRA
jgi:hypothetical protein